MYDRTEFIFDKVAQDLSTEKNDITPIKKVLEGYNFYGKSVLEVGCGVGDNLIYCAQKGARYAEGFDISNESIKLAKKKAKGLPNIAFHKCSLMDYRMERQFDFILAWGVFEYFEDPVGSLKKISCLLADNGTMILLISRPIFIKRISFLCRVFLSKIPSKTVLPAVIFISKILKAFNLIFKKMLYTGSSNSYSIERTIIESLMVPRYNIFHHRMFTDYLRGEGFSIELLNAIVPSMIGIAATKDKSACRKR